MGLVPLVPILHLRPEQSVEIHRTATEFRQAQYQLRRTVVLGGRLQHLFHPHEVVRVRLRRKDIQHALEYHVAGIGGFHFRQQFFRLVEAPRGI